MSKKIFVLLLCLLIPFKLYGLTYDKYHKQGDKQFKEGYIDKAKLSFMKSLNYNKKKMIKYRGKTKPTEKEISYTIKSIKCFERLGDVYAYLGNKKKAEKYYNNGLKLANEFLVRVKTQKDVKAVVVSQITNIKAKTRPLVSDEVDVSPPLLLPLGITIYGGGIMSNSTDRTTDPLFSSGGGITLDFYFLKYFAVSSGAFYTQGGFKNNYGTMKNDYIRVPLWFFVYLAKDKTITPFVTTGLGTNFLMTSRFHSNDSDSSFNSSSAVKTTSFDADFGIGIDFNFLPIGKLGLSILVSAGLGDLYSEQFREYYFMTNARSNEYVLLLRYSITWNEIVS